MSVLKSTASWCRTLYRACHRPLPVKLWTPPVLQGFVPRVSVTSAQRQVSKLSVPHGHLPDGQSGSMYAGQSGSGFYGSWLGGQDADNINVVKNKIFKMVDTIPAPRGNQDDWLFTIGDYGTADGAVSMPLLRDLIEFVRNKHGEIPIQIIYEDQPNNDFNSIFKRVHGLIPDPPTYLNDFDQVYVMTSGTSFYDQVMPDSTADLIVSFLSAQWLSRRPTTLQNSLCRSLGASEKERRLITEQAAEDWERFLVLRARELKSGGVLVVSTSSEASKPNEDGVRFCHQAPTEDLLTIWRSMRDEGHITQEEFVNTNLDLCQRYLEEIRLPFDDVNSAVTEAGLRLINAEQTQCRSLALNRWQEKLEKEGVDDRAMFAKTVVNQSRCWSNSAFIAGLSSSRSHSQKEALVDMLYQRPEAKAAASDPRDYKSFCLLNYVFAQKL